MAFRFLSPFRPRRDGTIAVRLTETERAVLSDVAAGLREQLSAQPDAEHLERLFPSPHPDDEAAAEEWQRYMHEELVQSRLAALDVLTDTLEADAVTPEQLHAWLQCANAVRLVLGTRLGATEEPPQLDPDDPELMSWAVYEFLGMVVDAGVRALQPSLDAPTAGGVGEPRSDGPPDAGGPDELGTG